MPVPPGISALLGVQVDAHHPAHLAVIDVQETGDIPSKHLP